MFLFLHFIFVVAHIINFLLNPRYNSSNNQVSAQAITAALCCPAICPCLVSVISQESLEGNHFRFWLRPVQESSDLVHCDLIKIHFLPPSSILSLILTQKM